MGSGSVLGFDFGLKRIGVAVGTLELKLAHPLETIAIETTDARFARIGKLIEEWQPALAVVGIPHHGDDSAHEFAPTCLRFAQRLKGRFGLNVALVDESYSSAAAKLHTERIRHSRAPAKTRARPGRRPAHPATLFRRTRSCPSLPCLTQKRWSPNWRRRSSPR